MMRCKVNTTLISLFALMMPPNAFSNDYVTYAVDQIKRETVIVKNGISNFDHCIRNAKNSPQDWLVSCKAGYDIYFYTVQTDNSHHLEAISDAVALRKNRRRASEIINIGQEYMYFKKVLNESYSRASSILTQDQKSAISGVTYTKRK